MFFVLVQFYLKLAFWIIFGDYFYRICDQYYLVLDITYFGVLFGYTSYEVSWRFLVQSAKVGYQERKPSGILEVCSVEL